MILDEFVAVARAERASFREYRTKRLILERYDAMAEAFREAEVDPGVRVILLTGTPDAFTAGNDLGTEASVDAFDTYVQWIRTYGVPSPPPPPQ